MNSEQVESHALWLTLDDFKQVISDGLESAEGVSRDAVHRLHAVTQYIESIRSLDPALLDEDALGSINSELTQARDAANMFVQDTDANSVYLTNSVASATSALQSALRTLPSPPAAGAAAAAQDALERYRTAADSRIDELQNRVAALQQEIEQTRSEDAQRVEEAQAGLAALQEKIAEGDQQVATQTTQLQEQIETQRASFRDEVEQREASFKQDAADHADAAKKARDAEADQAAAIIDDLEKKREQAAALLKATSDDVISGDYRGWATKQGKIAFRWDVATVAIGLITVGALVWVVLGARNDSTQFLISKSAVGLIGLIVAGYAARQASDHRAEERIANRLALDLAALEPFLENVAEPEKLRSEIARRVFVPVTSEETDHRFWFGRKSMTLSELLELVKLLRPPPSG